MSFASSETSMHVNAKQAAKNVKMLPETPNHKPVSWYKRIGPTSVTASLETLYKQLRASASI